MKYLAAILIFLFSQALKAQSADDILGVWLTENNKSKVKVYKKGDEYYGKIIWLKEPRREDGSIKLDRENPDEELRDRKIEGIEILTALIWEEDDEEWDDGEIYDPESGSTYDCYAVMMDDGRLKLRGYIGFSMIGRSTYWRRAE